MIAKITRYVLIHSLFCLPTSCDFVPWNSGDDTENDPPEIYELDDTKEIVSSGLTRTFHIHLPSRTPGLPVVFALHGGGETGVIIKGYSGFDASADSLGFIIVYPEAHKPFGWGDEPVAIDVNQTIDDIRFISDIILKLEEDLQIDRSRIFATGFSAGGFLSYALAAHMPDRIAAIAPMAASMSPINADDYPEDAAIPALVIQGTQDSAVLWEGSENANFPYLSQEAVLQILLRNNGCADIPDTELLPPKFEGIDVRRERYPDPDGIDAVQRIVIEGGDHYYPSMLFDVPELILSFFREISSG